MTMNIRFAISIGTNCKTRYQLDQFMLRKLPNFRPISFFFDWLKLGNLNGVINIVERGFNIEHHDILIHDENGKFIPRDKRSGFVFLHDFGTKNKYWNSYSECEIALASTIDNSIAKFKFLGLRTDQLLSSNLNLGLVYFGDESKQHFSKLKEVLENRYQKEFLLINVLEEGSEPAQMDGSVLNIFVNDGNSPNKGTPQEWKGSDLSWHQALSKIPFEWMQQ